MPWQFGPMKDGCMSPISTVSPQAGVISCWFPNGVTHPVLTGYSTIYSREGTQGTETSQYLEEKKSYEISSVAASESEFLSRKGECLNPPFGRGLRDPHLSISFE